MSGETALRDAIVRHAASMFERGLTFGSSGNLSARCDDGFLITPTNSCLGFLDPARLSKIDANGRHIAGDPPSKEVFLHAAFYASRDKAQGVVHLHSTYATALSCCADIDPENALPMLTPYAAMRIGRVALLPYLRPGDPAMGPLIAALQGRFAALLLANHGPVVSGTTFADAVYAAEELEETAKLFFVLHGHKARTLTPDQVGELDRVFQGMR